jgi:hypothetical protein
MNAADSMIQCNGDADVLADFAARGGHFQAPVRGARHWLDSEGRPNSVSYWITDELPLAL